MIRRIQGKEEEDSPRRKTWLRGPMYIGGYEKDSSTEGSVNMALSGRCGCRAGDESTNALPPPSSWEWHGIVSDGQGWSTRAEKAFTLGVDRLGHARSTCRKTTTSVSPNYNSVILILAIRPEKQIAPFSDGAGQIRSWAWIRAHSKLG
jgi:hypothetical protein